MASATFEDHPTDPNKVIFRKKPYLNKGADYEHGFIDGMQYQMQSSVDRAVNAMSQRTWAGLTDEEQSFIYDQVKQIVNSKPFWVRFADAIEAKIKEKNSA